MHISYIDSSVNVLAFLDSELSKVSQRENITINLTSAKIHLENLPSVLEKLRTFHIKELNLSCNGLGDNGAIFLANALKTQNIAKLELSYNDIGDSGAEALAGCLRVKQGVEIGVTHNKIGPRGALAWTDAVLQSNRQTIDLSSNKIGNEGATLLAKKLNATRGSVNRLVLKHNEIGFQGDKDLAIHLPSTIKIIHRVAYRPFVEENPITSLVIAIITCGLGAIALPFMKSENELEGCEYQAAAPSSAPEVISPRGAMPLPSQGGRYIGRVESSDEYNFLGIVSSVALSILGLALFAEGAVIVGLFLIVVIPACYLIHKTASVMRIFSRAIG